MIQAPLERKVRVTSFLKVKLPAAVAIVVLAAYVVFLEVEASQNSDEKIGSPAVWDAGNQALQQIRDSCKNSDEEDYSQCFIDHMADAGAPAEAVDFTQEYALEHGGDIAILKDFHPMDAVDLGHAYFPESKETRQSVVLLNGSPEIVEASDLKLLSQEQIAHDPHYAALRSAYPKIGIFSEEDAIEHGIYPPMQKLSNGGQSFAIAYSLREGCGSCAVLGHAVFSFDFDAAGQFHGTRLIKVEPLSTPKPAK